MVKERSSSATAQAASPAPSSSSSAPFTGDPLLRKFTKDNANINRTNDTARNNCIGLMYNGLAYRSQEPVENIVLKAVEIEKAAYDAYKLDSYRYKVKLRSLFQNLKHKNNVELGQKIMSGEISAERFVIMDSQELKSADLKKLEEDYEAENMKKAQVPMAEKSISDALTCGKCKQKKVSYSQAQTRSADEPMTTFCECTVCGNRWKVCYPLFLFLILFFPLVQYSLADSPLSSLERGNLLACRILLDFVFVSLVFDLFYFYDVMDFSDCLQSSCNSLRFLVSARAFTWHRR